MHIVYARCQTSRNKDGQLAQNILAVISDRKQVFTGLMLAPAQQLIQIFWTHFRIPYRSIV